MSDSSGQLPIAPDLHLIVPVLARHGGGSNTYCMGRVNGHLCHTTIPTTERLCPECKKREAAQAQSTSASAGGRP